MAGTLHASVIIPTYGRPDSYAACVASLQRQTEVAYELIPIRERAPLVWCRNEGLRRATAPVVCFIDDDVVCPPGWLAGVLDAFRAARVVGVSGPAIITPYFRYHRDLFRYRHLKRLHDWCFVDNPQQPGHLTCAGTYTTAAADEDCTYDGEVDYLEACNMSFRTAALKAVGGFDESFKGIGDWSEPDAGFRVRRATGGVLWFTPRAALFHQPALGGPTVHRWKDARNRMENYTLFASRWVRPHPRATAYRAFLAAYYTLNWMGGWLTSGRKAT